MSDELNGTSNEAQDKTENPSVFDFLYQDARRVASLLGQFDNFGVLQSITHKQSFSETGSQGNELSAEANVLALKGTGKQTANTSKNEAGESSKAYDPYWHNSLNLLKYLRDQHYLHENVKDARLGQIVLVSGDLRVFDLSVVKTLITDFKTLHRAMNDGKPPANAKEAEKQKAIAKLLSQLPLMPQAILTNGEHKLWAVLKEDCLEINASSLFLTYGVSVTGTWHMLGILDAKPSDIDPPDTSGEMETIVDAMRSLGPMGRRIGRPADAFGVTPLLIFRKVEVSESDPHTLDRSD